MEGWRGSHHHRRHQFPPSGRPSDQMRAWVAGTWAVRSLGSRAYQHVRYTPLPRTRCSIHRANAGCPTQPTADPPPLHIKLSPKPRSAALLASAPFPAKGARLLCSKASRSSSQVTDDKVHIDECFPPSGALHSPVRASPPFTRNLPPL